MRIDCPVISKKYTHGRYQLVQLSNGLENIIVSYHISKDQGKPIFLRQPWGKSCIAAGKTTLLIRDIYIKKYDHNTVKEKFI